MASKTACSSLRLTHRRVRRKCFYPNSIQLHRPVRQFSISSMKSDIQETEPEHRPRWAFTPPKMKARVPHRIKDPAQEWECNKDPVRLDRFYNKLLGRGGAEILTEDAKWLAITHKSFDQGRRGFNDRLAFFGRRILDHQTTLALLFDKTTKDVQSYRQDPNDDREPFKHPSLEGLTNLKAHQAVKMVNKKRLGQLGSQMGMAEIMRWKPRLPDNLEASGIEVALAQSLYAIIGAVALQKGGQIANAIAQERVLKPLGLS